MREKAINIYFIILFFALNLIYVDFSALGINLRTMLFFAVTTVTLIFLSCNGRRHFQWKKLTCTDWIIFVIMLMTLFRLIYEIVNGAEDINPEIAALAIGMSYFILRQCKVELSMLFQAYGLSNFMVCIMLLISRLSDGWGSDATQYLTSSGGITAWLVLGICVSILAYCTTDSKKQRIFYGADVLLGAFLLFMEKNMTAILLIEALFIMIPFLFKPTKVFIRRVMELFLLYNFLLCNMSLLTGYVSVLKGSVTYDLEVSVYLELILAVIGLGYFELWDRCAKGKDEQDILPEMLSFFQVIAIAGAIFMGALFAAATRGASVVLPEVMYKLLSLFILSISEQNGIFYTTGERYGVIGAALVMVFLCILTMSCVRNKAQTSEEHRMLKSITIIYIIQSIFLRQTIVTTPIYMVFVILYWEGTRLMERNISDEANHSDTML